MFCINSAAKSVLCVVLGTWVLAPARAQDVAWSEMVTDGPSARWGAAMAYDSARGVTVLFGGKVADGDNGETWEWDGTGWTRKEVDGPAPSPRTSHAMAFDEARGVTVLFGGYAGSDDGNGETWTWNGASWTQHQPINSPSPRYYGAMAYDSARGMTVLFGGIVQTGEPPDAATWEWDGSNWMQRCICGPAPRCCHAMAYDEARGVTMLFGGALGSNRPDRWNRETWEWNGSGWTQTCICGPAPRNNHAMAYDAHRGVSVLFGGEIEGDPSTQYNGETWKWDGVDWTEMTFTSGTPLPRTAPAMAYDSMRREIVLFGGQGSGDSLFSDTWVLGVECLADFDRSGTADIPDIFGFLSVWFTGAYPQSDFNNDQAVNVSDVFAFLAAWFAGCP